MSGINKLSEKNNEAFFSYPEHIATLIKNPRYFGRMNDPTSAAVVRGPCGDEMEFYLIIKDRTIEEVKFYTEGCISTVACGAVTAQLALGKSIDGALNISPAQIIETLTDLPQSQSHCSILAVSTLYRAIADYLLKK